MANGSSFLIELSGRVAELKQELRQVQAEAEAITNKASEIQRDIYSLEKTARLYRHKHSMTESIDPKALKGMTQINALVAIARKGGGQLRANEAKRLMLQAGLISNPANAASIVYTLIKRSERFDRVEAGVYKLQPRRRGQPARPARITEIRTA